MLNELKHTSEIQNYSVKNLEELAVDCRQRILEVISKTGGHLASSLGSVELTVALAKVFDFERDRLIWDVGHQAYTYKILTGRNEALSKLGQKGGISKFLSRFESPYDHFGAGQASTSISAALGISAARNLINDDFHSVAIIGDGAIDGGLAFEALNHAGHLDENLIVILNDNEMSIDANVGALSRGVLNISSSKSFNQFRAEVIRQIREHKVPRAISNTLDKVNDSMMAFFTKGVWFEKFNFRYFGQVDGHNVKKLVSFFKLTKDLRGPILLHVLTRKGKGYLPAEKEPAKFHGVGPFDLATGKPIPSKSNGRSYTAIFSKTFNKIIDEDPKVVGISAAMLANTGLASIQKTHPDRIFDVGIAEGHAVTFAGGIATQGLKPFVVIYSTFLQRAIDHIVHDIARQNLNVRFVLDRGGFVGPDGATHHGVLDLTYLRMIPEMVILAPKNGLELQSMLKFMWRYDTGPIAIRFPRGNSNEYSDDELAALPEYTMGQGELVRSGTDILFLAAGSMVESAALAAEQLEKQGVSTGLINARFIKPLDESLITTEVDKAKMVVTLEENAVKGGFGSGVLELLAEKMILKPVLQLGIPDQFIRFSSREDQLIEAGLDVDTIVNKTLEKWNKFQ